jgi:hypothetical protein
MPIAVEAFAQRRAIGERLNAAVYCSAAIAPTASVCSTRAEVTRRRRCDRGALQP